MAKCTLLILLALWLVILLHRCTLSTHHRHLCIACHPIGAISDRWLVAVAADDDDDDERIYFNVA